MCAPIDLNGLHERPRREPLPPAAAETRPDVQPPARPLPNALALSYAPIIRRMAVRLRHRLPPYVSVDDLVGAGFVGLILAYGRYDPARCDQFEGYAKWRIRGAMLDEIRSYDYLSRDIRAFAAKMNAATRRLQTQLGRHPAEAELAGELGLPLDAFRTCAAVIALGPAVSIDALCGDDGSPAEPFDTSAVAAEERLANREASRSLLAAVEALPARLREVLQLYYGEELTLRHIGDRLGVTESRVCQLRAEAIARLRAASAEQDEERCARVPLRGAPAFESWQLAAAGAPSTGQSRRPRSTACSRRRRSRP